MGLDNDKSEGAYTHVEGKNVIVAFNPAKIDAANVAHEGVHAEQALDFVKTGKNPTVFGTENKAYMVGALTSVGLSDDKTGNTPQYAPTAINGENTVIWGIVKGKSLLQVRLDIPNQIATHLSNNGLTSTSREGIKKAFPGSKGNWR